MSFIQHLEELRWHIIRSVIAILAVTIVVFVGKDFVFGTIIFGPKEASFPTYQFTCWLSESLNMGDRLCLTPTEFPIQNLKMTGLFLTHIKVSLILGFILAFPYVLWETWRFLKPGLYEKEIKATGGFVFYCSLLFITGVSFAYFVVIPFSMNFLVSYDIGTDSVNSFIELTDFIGYLTMVVLAAGLIFELPILVYFLSKLGLLTPEFMRKYRKHSVVVTLFVSAIITPPDVASQFLIAVPVFILYEIGISISAKVNKKREEELAA